MGQSKLLAGFFGLAIHHISMDLRNPHIRAADKALNPLGKFGNPITKLSSNVFVMKAWKGAWKIATLITHQCYHPCSENIRGTLSKVASWILFSPCWIKSCSIEILPFFHSTHTISSNTPHPNCQAVHQKGTHVSVTHDFKARAHMQGYAPTAISYSNPFVYWPQIQHNQNSGKLDDNCCRCLPVFSVGFGGGGKHHQPGTCMRYC